MKTTAAAIQQVRGISPPRKRSRAERKAAMRARWAQHPVTAGIVPVVAYHPPGHYGPVPVSFPGQTAFNPSIQSV